MFPNFDADRKRKLNLGGASSSSSSSTSILRNVQAEREARAAQRRRADSATQIQSWYRDLKESRRTREEVKAMFEADVKGLTGLRCLVLICRRGKDREVEEALSRWAVEVAGSGPQAVWAPVLTSTSSNQATRIVLLCQVGLFLVRAVADSPRSPHAPTYLSVLNSLLSKDVAEDAADTRGDGLAFVQSITEYLIGKGLYELLGQAIERIPANSKKSPVYPPLLSLITLPLSTFSSTSPQYISIFARILAYILSVPLLPNRLPLDELSKFIARLPLSRFHLFQPHLHELEAELEKKAKMDEGISKVHLAATLYTVFSAQYKALLGPALETYLDLSTLLLKEFPVGILCESNPEKKGATTDKGTSVYEPSSEDEEGVPPTPLPQSLVLDPKTLARLHKIVSPAQLSSLFSATRSTPNLFPHLISYLFALKQAWTRGGSKYSVSIAGTRAGVRASGKKTKKGNRAEVEVLRTILASSGSGGGLVRDLYTELVRTAPIGKDEGGADVLDPANASHYQPLLLFTDLYSQALLTMGDDEFFGTSSQIVPSSSSELLGASASATVPRNPLTLEELVSFSKQLLNIAFILYWKGDPTFAGTYVSAEVRCTWEEVREKVTKCLLAVHARDSRRPFVPPDHWLVTSHLDVNSDGDPWKSFIDAAIIEEQQLALQDDSRRNRGPRIKHQSRLAQILTPRLGILNNIPFAIPFDVRVRIFREFVRADAAAHAQRLSDREARARPLPRRPNPGLGINRIPTAEEVEAERESTRRRAARATAASRANAQRTAQPDPPRTTINIAVRVDGRNVLLPEDDLGGGMEVDDDGEGEGDAGDQGRNEGDISAVDVAAPHGPTEMAQPGVLIRREMVAQDGFEKLARVDLKFPVKIVFVDQFGQEEAGIDGGGVFKEFFTLLCQEVFNPDRGLWLVNKKNELYPNPHGYATERRSLDWYRFIGRILGKALYEGILVDIAFAGFFLAKWLGRQSFLDDLASLDSELYNGLIYLKNYPGNPEDLALNFTVAVDESAGVTRTIGLIPNGSNITVTRENRLQYIFLVSSYRLNRQIRSQSEAFFDGLSEMIHHKWLRMFNQSELQLLVGGTPTPISVDDLREHTSYVGPYDSSHPTVILFWFVLSAFSQADLRAFLRFVTSCSRPPLLGFKELRPGFAIHDAGGNQDRLPSASTCVNLLKLPRYETAEVLKEKVLKAIWAGAGFDLS
ncbi:hypothetical protein NLJ89_g7135 [Agrocybe chaxingu]|uniref:HECT-type E3 ubiquitin transferase n=1 Tax=Agrocybe chaxingu TaxID=84603 RepID=A0A9W8MS17_9AGAR|nr:hypothetical protein NLJ89_g7135 [Agrocybe chaxingu]